MDITFLSTLHEGPVRSGLIILASILLVSLLAIIQYTGIMLLRRLSRNSPFTTTTSFIAFRAIQMCLLLFAIRLILTGAAEDTPWLVPPSYLTSVALIFSLIWLVMRCIESVSITVINNHPANITDNLKVRRVITQTQVLAHSANFIATLIGLSFVRLTLPGARQLGTSILASAGVAGIVAGIAARPVIGNFIAGLQITFSQPIHIDDILIFNGEWG